MGITIRSPELAEAGSLTELCRRSKAHWGYDERFMAQCDEALQVRAEWIASDRVIMAELGCVPAGVAAIARDGPDFEVAVFFIEPAQMGKGVGGALFRAMLARAKEQGIGLLKVLSDPNAEGFYRKMGARLIGTAPSDAIPGRRLPLLEIDIPG